MAKIQIYDRKDGVTKLGPGCRYVIWTQGCPRKCPGCMTPESQPTESGRQMETDLLAEEVIKSGREGITISGGEPFLQAGPLTEMIKQARRKRDIGVMVYTGYTIEELQKSKDPAIQEFLSEIDLLVDGPYIARLNDGKNVRGSSNQKVIPLTGRYLSYAKEAGSRPAEVEFFMEEDHISMIGIPDCRTLERFQRAFCGSGN